MAGRGLSFKDAHTIQMDTVFISSITVRMYCKCGDAIRVSGEPLYVESSVDYFNGKHNKPGCEPCDSKTAARAMAKRGRLAGCPVIEDPDMPKDEVALVQPRTNSGMRLINIGGE